MPIRNNTVNSQLARLAAAPVLTYDAGCYGVRIFSITRSKIVTQRHLRRNFHSTTSEKLSKLPANKRPHLTSIKPFHWFFMENVRIL